MNLYPNPSSESSTLSLTLPENDFISVTISDVLGRNIVNIAEGNYPEGLNTFSIPVKEKLNKGIYFIKLSCGEYNHIVKFIAE